MNLVHRPRPALDLVRRGLLPVAFAACAATATAGGTIASATDPGLLVNAWGGALHLAPLRTVNNCPAGNTDCQWSFRDGMIVSDSNPALAWNAHGGARPGADVRVVSDCTPSNPDCTWTIVNGMIVSNANLRLAVNAYGGARHLNFLKLVDNCSPELSDCVWTLGTGTAAATSYSGTLRVSDCDEVEYTMSRSRVDPFNARITFAAAAGVRGWKLVKLPRRKDTNLELQLNRGPFDKALPTDVFVPIAQLDPGRPIRFEKAGALGFHTPLSFVWDILPAVTAGTDLHIRWVRESCSGVQP